MVDTTLEELPAWASSLRRHGRRILTGLIVLLGLSAALVLATGWGGPQATARAGAELTQDDRVILRPAPGTRLDRQIGAKAGAYRLEASLAADAVPCGGELVTACDGRRLATRGHGELTSLEGRRIGTLSEVTTATVLEPEPRGGKWLVAIEADGRGSGFTREWTHGWTSWRTRPLVALELGILLALVLAGLCTVIVATSRRLTALIALGARGRLKLNLALVGMLSTTIAAAQLTLGTAHPADTLGTGALGCFVIGLSLRFGVLRVLHLARSSGRAVELLARMGERGGRGLPALAAVVICVGSATVLVSGVGGPLAQPRTSFTLTQADMPAARLSAGTYVQRANGGGIVRGIVAESAFQCPDRSGRDYHCPVWGTVARATELFRPGFDKIGDLFDGARVTELGAAPERGYRWVEVRGTLDGAVADRRWFGPGWERPAGFAPAAALYGIGLAGLAGAAVTLLLLAGRTVRLLRGWTGRAVARAFGVPMVVALTGAGGCGLMAGLAALADRPRLVLTLLAVTDVALTGAAFVARRAEVTLTRDA